MFNLVNETMRVHLMDAGGGSKDTDGAIDDLLIGLVAMLEKDRPQVIWFVYDCGPLQMNKYQVQMAQWLVDHGL